MASETQTAALSPSAAASAITKVAIVEDQRDIREGLASLIKFTDGYQCTGTFRSMEEALEKVRFELPHIVLVDIGLPGMSGYEVARHLRKHPVLAKVLIVAVTGYGQEKDRRRARNAGFDLHVVKPLTADVLRTLLSNSQLLNHQLAHA